MKEKIFQELKGATFAVELTAHGAPLQADPDDVQKVFGHLRGDIYMTLFGDEASTENVPRLPPHGFKVESTSYKPLTHLLNNIVSAAKICLDRPGHLRDLHFYPYDVEMGDKLNLEKPLKPSIFGLLHPRASDGPKVSWNDVAVVIEVMANPVEVAKQLATYACCHLSLDRRRSFSVAISFSHRALTIRFFSFHRSGVSFSPELHLDKEQEFRSVVEHMVGILSIQDEEAFGLDLTRVEKMYRLNNYDYDIVRIIGQRNTIRGRSTAVYSLKL